uniref:Uncharacterized protein n=1 Tax=Hyaloperonospora arabidopsidis (strain Emoy2) TaxID=559515 RepID=M4BID4_HYAAE
MVFGPNLDGPELAKIAPLVPQALGFLMSCMAFDVVFVRDTLTGHLTTSASCTTGTPVARWCLELCSSCSRSWTRSRVCVAQRFLSRHAQLGECH